ncbi:MAG: hypothetical protein RL033_7067 [Pseudomonadota bacterium]
MRPGLIQWSSAALAALLGCERATPFLSSQTTGSNSSQTTALAQTTGSTTASAEPQQGVAPLAPRALDVANITNGAERADAAAAKDGRNDPATAVRSAAHPPSAEEPTGAPSPSCVNGWTAPGRNSPLRKVPLDMIRERKSERFVVLEMRYFRGPEDAEVIGPQREVERWYVKAESVGRNPRRQRWLVRRAEVGRGIDAVAEFDSTGHAPGTWKRPDASDDSVSDPFQRPCERPAAGEKCMGLPYAVLGCLDGT